MVAALVAFPIKLKTAVIRKSEANAIALPGGHIYVFEGLIEQAKSPAELAGVIGHEIGHVTARHSVQCQSCHAVMVFDPARVGQNCEFCGSPALVDYTEIKSPIRPQGVLPFRIDAATDTNNFQGRHTAAFSNDGKKVIQTDEWGGGTGPMCQASSMKELGGNTIISVDAKKKQAQHAYFKLPAAQSAEENCVSHNGGIIPVPGTI